MKEVVALHGITSEKEVYSQTIHWDETEMVAIEGIQVAPFLSVLKPVLIDEFSVSMSDQIPCKTVFEAIRHLKFTSQVPLFLNYRNTSNNIK